MSHAIILIKDTFRTLLLDYAWISSSAFALLFSLSPAPSLAGLGHVEFFWGVPRAFLSVFQNSEYPGNTPLRGSYHWDLCNLLWDWLFWLFVFLCAAVICATISKRVWGRVRSGIILLVCICVLLVLWVLYLSLICGNYFLAFYRHYVG
jgi:hypothetical protein